MYVLWQLVHHPFLLQPDHFIFFLLFKIAGNARTLPKTMDIRYKERVLVNGTFVADKMT